MSTSDSQDRKSYKLLEGEKVTVPVASLVQEHGLEWAREMRGGTGCELILSDASHVYMWRSCSTITRMLPSKAAVVRKVWA